MTEEPRPDEAGRKPKRGKGRPLDKRYVEADRRLALEVAGQAVSGMESATAIARRAVKQKAADDAPPKGYYRNTGGDDTEHVRAQTEAHVLRLKRKGDIARRQTPEYLEFWDSVNTESVVYERPKTAVAMPGPDSPRIYVDGANTEDDECS